ncbi:hypothetical protein [Haloplanus rubicundus]|uniref:Uncharacterized protein n=1 Tax=Haloplanus rubicundus TaxID=1547898 RepID=A0A345E853_9EURY|nr:hypothetical protein [Haloplanus rubicundus]AXG08375.1 hypothetical protein DU484_00070 [Haloplanus rubicundus]
MPIDWPEGFDRTPPERREPYPHNFRVSRRDAFENILTQLKRMQGASNVRISSEAEHLTRDIDVPRADASPDDPGVVVRFERDSKEYVLPCDRWSSLRDNAQAIAKYVEAKRALDRYGVKTYEDEFEAQKVRVD